MLDCPVQSIGSVAQLGERLACTEKVAGSSPVASTSHMGNKLPN